MDIPHYSFFGKSLPLTYWKIMQ